MKKGIVSIIILTSLFASPLGINSISAADDISQQTTATVSSVRQKVITKGLKYLGTPYEFGSSRSSTKTFDCSDFVRQAYLEGAGIKLPADSRAQGEFIKKNSMYTTNWKNLKAGDIMFFMSYRGSKASNYSGINKRKARITHNGIYLGNGKILQTYSEKSGGVRVDQMDGTQWEKRFLFGGSVLN
ncbi:Gamma-DL-glutamyl hydrolase precursor [compost metagenome]